MFANQRCILRMRQKRRMSGARMKCGDSFADNREQKLGLVFQALTENLVGDLDRRGQQLIRDLLIEVRYCLLHVVQNLLGISYNFV